MKITAPAKLNLFLHITGRRHDGYHLLESLFVFTEFGDTLTFTPADTLSLQIDGPFQATLHNEATEKNLAYRAAHLLKEHCDVLQNVRIQLTKNIPIAAGLGGGSSDAAAVLTGLNQFWQLGLNEQTLMTMGLSLGADVPACIAGHAAIVSGIGEINKSVTLPQEPLSVLLINPNETLSTQAVFRQLKESNSAFTPSQPHPVEWKNHPDLYAYLIDQHNDLESPAITLSPAIHSVLHNLKKQTGCTLARMSGSGSTCFGLFENAALAMVAQKALQQANPHWWFQHSQIKCTAS